MRNHPTSWQKVTPWYNKITEHGQGHYFHQHVVIPGVIRLLGFDNKSIINNQHSKILDLACGNGVLAKAVPKDVEYTGVDIAPGLINEAKRTDRNPKHKYIVADVTRKLPVSGKYDAATIILALQNIQNPQRVIENASKLLNENSKLIIVLNHPAFRIPRQSSWGIDEGRKIQYRRVDRYMSPMNIPILMNPGDRNSRTTMSYHFPLSAYSKMLRDAGFAIDLIEEWTSDRESLGSASKMENRGRAEIPIFMAIIAKKC